MYRQLAAAVGLLSATALPAAAAVQHFTIDPTQSFVTLTEGVWAPYSGNSLFFPPVVLPGQSAWEVQWQPRQIAIGGTFDLEILDSPDGTSVKRLAITNAQVTGDVPATAQFTAPRMLSWFPESAQVAWSETPGYNDGFFANPLICACFTTGPTRSEAGAFNGAMLDVQGGIGTGPTFVFMSPLVIDGDGPPVDPIDQSLMLGSFSYRLVASPAPEPETFLLLGLGLPLLGWMARRRRG